MATTLLDLTQQGDVGTITDESKLASVQLMNPQQLYQLWEKQNWVSQTIDFTKDKEDWAGFTDEVGAKFPAQFSQRTAFQRPIGNSTVIPGKPSLADRISGNLTRIDRSKVAGAPHTLVKLRMQP